MKGAVLGLDEARLPGIFFNLAKCGTEEIVMNNDIT